MRSLSFLLPAIALVYALVVDVASANPPANSFTFRSRSVVQGNGVGPSCSAAGCVAPAGQAIYSQQVLQAPILQAPVYAASVLAAPVYAQPLLAASVGGYSQSYFQSQGSFRQRAFLPGGFGSPFNGRLGLNFNFRRR